MFVNIRANPVHAFNVYSQHLLFIQFDGQQTIRAISLQEFWALGFG